MIREGSGRLGCTRVVGEDNRMAHVAQSPTSEVFSFAEDSTYHIFSLEGCLLYLTLDKFLLCI